jgi:hypothetical protein
LPLKETLLDYYGRDGQLTTGEGWGGQDEHITKTDPTAFGDNDSRCVDGTVFINT